MWPKVTVTDGDSYRAAFAQKLKVKFTLLSQGADTKFQLNSSKNEEVQVSFIQGWKMYHTTLLQKFIGTKHFAAGEKAIKSWFF